MPRPVAFAAFTAFVLMLGLGVLFPVLPFLTRELAIPDAQAGWLLASYPLASFATSPLWGRFSERRGRKPALVIGLGGYALGFALFALGRNFAELLGARVLGGAISAAALPALFAYVADVTSAERRSAGMGALGAGIGMGVTFGPVIGWATWALAGLRAPYFVAAGIGLVAALGVAFALPESLPRERRRELALAGRDGPRTSLWRVALPLAPFLLAGFLTSTARIAVDSTLGFFAQDELGATPRGVAGLLFSMGVVSVLVQGGAMRALSGRVSDAALFLAGAAAMCAGLAGFGFASSWTGLAVAGVPIAVGWALLSPTLAALLSRAAEDVQGEAQGLSNSATSLSRVVAPFLFTTTLWPSFGGPGVYLVAAGLAALALAVGLARFRAPARASYHAAGAAAQRRES